MVLRAELRRLFLWLKDKGVTAIITGERGDGQFTRQGLEEYVSDSVTLLDHRVTKGLSRRALRVVKYRGSTHGSNEYPFLITKSGISILPVTSIGLRHAASLERVSSGVPQLDEMLGGEGFYSGSTILISGMAGTGKTSIAAHFAKAACARGERALYFSFEESEDQFYRNMMSIGIDLEPFAKQGLFKHSATRPTGFGLEMHLINLYDQLRIFNPSVVICDPISAFLDVGTTADVKNMLTRLIDHFKTTKVTAMFINLAMDAVNFENTDLGISSLIDSWLKLCALEHNAERNRSVQIIKSRGMNHSNQIREFCLSDQGITLVDVYIGPKGILTGSAREAQVRLEQKASEQQLFILEQKRQAMEGKVQALRAAYEADCELIKLERADEERRSFLNAAVGKVKTLRPSVNLETKTHLTEPTAHDK